MIVANSRVSEVRGRVGGLRDFAYLPLICRSSVHVPLPELEERTHNAVQPDPDPVLPGRVEAELGATEAQGVRECELDGIAEHIRILNLVHELVLWTSVRVERVHERGMSSHLERDALMVQQAHIVHHVFCAPDFVPLALRILPLGLFLLQPHEDDRQRQRRQVLHCLKDLEPRLSPVDLFEKLQWETHSLFNTGGRQTCDKHGVCYWDSFFWVLAAMG